jgi:transposase
MEHYAGIDVSLELSSMCVVDAQGKIVKEAKVASEPEALVGFFKVLGFTVKRIGLEAGPLSQWLHAGLTRAGFETVLLETRHVKAALSAMTVKTDRKDARGLAQLMRMGMVPAGARQIDRIAGGPSSAGCAQAATWAAYRRGIEHPGDPAQLRPEGRPCDTQEF